MIKVEYYLFTKYKLQAVVKELWMSAGGGKENVKCTLKPVVKNW